MTKEARIAVRSYMEQISENLYCAGWFTGLEYMLWDWVLDTSKKDDEMASVLSWLANQAGGWWRWSKETGEPCFVTMSEWKKLYGENRQTMTDKNYRKFFNMAMGWMGTDYGPYPYQKKLATGPWPELLVHAADWGALAKIENHTGETEAQ